MIVLHRARVHMQRCLDRERASCPARSTPAAAVQKENMRTFKRIPASSIGGATPLCAQPPRNAVTAKLELRGGAGALLDAALIRAC